MFGQFFQQTGFDDGTHALFLSMLTVKFVQFWMVMVFRHTGIAVRIQVNVQVLAELFEFRSQLFVDELSAVWAQRLVNKAQLDLILLCQGCTKGNDDQSSHNCQLHVVSYLTNVD